MSALIDWDRLPTETPKSYAAFLALGARRSVREAARQYHINTTSTGEISWGARQYRGRDPENSQNPPV